MVEVECSYCGGGFCLQHRHQVDHSCSALVLKSGKIGHRPDKATPGTSVSEQEKAWSSAKGIC
jgi:predicted nucleic acid binding AN1-type Zn finger protein